MRKLTRKDLLLASGISVLAIFGALAALSGQSRWALLVVIVFLAVIGLLLVVRHRSTQNHWEKVLERLDRNDAAGRSARESLTRASDRMNRLDQWADDLTSQVREISGQNLAMVEGIRGVEGKVKDITRDMYDLTLAMDDHLDAVEGALQHLNAPTANDRETDR